MLRKGIATMGIACTALVGIAACGPTSGSHTVQPKAATSPAYPSCSSLAGEPTADVVADPTCTQEDGSLLVPGVMDESGPKGHAFWNDTGWGVEGGTWKSFNRPDGQLIPPDSYLN